MSCHRIIMKGGHKVCLPVNSPEEYLKLRGTRSQHILVDAVHHGEEDKKRLLLEMNYSCVPGEDGLLAGCKTPSNSVGMDIDHIPPEKMQEVRDRILQKKDELGLLMLERSAREEGYHLVFRRHPELSQEENLRWAAGLLEVAFDEGAKDITRVFYTTTDSPEDLIYLDDELFEIKSVEWRVESLETVEKVDSGKSTLNSKLTTDSKLYTLNSQLSYHGIPYSEIIDKWWLQNGGIPQQGERNVKLYQLAVHLRGICDNSKALLLSIMPRLGLPESEVQSIVESACREQPKGITRAMKQVLAEQDEEYARMTEGYNPPPMPKRLPRFQYLCLKPYPEEYRPALALAQSVISTPHASHFRTTYIDGRVITPALYVAYVGPSGSNKGFVAHLQDEMTKNTLQVWDANEWAKVRENQELREKMANAKEKPVRYRPKLRIAETTSKTSLLELHSNLGDNGM